MGQLCLLVGTYGVRYLPSQGDWEIGALPFLMITFQRDGSRFLRKTFLDCKAGKRLGEDLLLKEAEKVFAITSFLK